MILDKQIQFIINATNDAMMAVDINGIITLFNKKAQELVGCSEAAAVGHPVEEVVTTTRLPYILKTGESELNRQQPLNHTTIVTSRMPVFDENHQIIGAVAIFRDISEASKQAEELTNVKSIESMLKAVFNAVQDAITVVDENGIGIMINLAYTRVTGLTSQDVIGKPAEADISGGESVHRMVIRTKKPVNGALMKVGPAKKEVLVHGAPIIVDGVLKGSVAVLHDVTEINELDGQLRQAKSIIRKLEAKYTFEDIAGNCESIRAAISEASKAAETPATVLLRGESGTGKELFAHAIHNASRRKYNQFVKINCAAITDSLLESELFGYEEGAFTGAKKGGKKGLFEEADKGTIFLDEIGEMSVETQVKLLRVLQEKEIIRVGGVKAIPIDVRVIAATNVDIEQAIKNGKFRSDLYYRLNIFPINIPPLRERKEDLSLLTRIIIRKFNQEYGRNIINIQPELLEEFKIYSWPGNIRELENIIGRAIINMKIGERIITRKHLPETLLFKSTAVPFTLPLAKSEEQVTTLEELVSIVEKQYIQKILKECDGNKSRTAKLLNISIRSLYYKLERYQIQE